MAAQIDFAALEAAGTPIPGAQLNSSLVQKDSATNDLILGDGTLISKATKGEVYAYSNLGQSIPNVVWTPINFNVESIDDTNSHVAGVITIPAGVTNIRGVANVGFGNNSTGQRLVQVTKNGVTDIGGGYIRKQALFGSEMNISFDISVTAGDTIEFQVYQDSGAALNMSTLGVLNWIRARMY